MYKIYIQPSNTGKLLTTIAIGEKYLDLWEKNSMNNWIKYCKNHEIGLIVFIEDLLSKKSPFWKKATWQKMLIGKVIKKDFPIVNQVCYLDTDILINPYSPDVFNFVKLNSFGLVSLRKNLPYPYEEVLRRVAFLRNRFYDNKYPLDSALFISITDLYKYHSLSPKEDEACAGFFIFNVNQHADKMEEIFNKYDKNIESITGGGDQTHFNYEIQSNMNVEWIDYRFQAIWLFEMAWKYPFLYENASDDIIRQCIEASLYSNFFLHFAGSWYESEMWKIMSDITEDKAQLMKNYYIYKSKKLSGIPQGIIKPESR